MQVDELGDTVVAIALTLPRIVAAFLVLPLLTRQVVPALVRNSLFVSLALVAFPITMAQDAGAFAVAAWPVLLLKEVFLGASLGFLFGSVFWAISLAGGIIDTQAGSNLANVMDPVQGHQTSLSGQWMSRLASVLFMVTGAFLVFLDLLMSSYALWPVQEMRPELAPDGALLFIGEFGYIMTTGLLIAAPAMMVLAMSDLVFGLVNRYAQQINILQFSLAVKHWLATWVLILVLGTIVEILLRKLFENRQLLERLDAVFR